MLLTKRGRLYFDSYGQITSVEIQRYLKIGSEFKSGSEVIRRITDISCEYVSVWSPWFIRIEIINKR